MVSYSMFQNIQKKNFHLMNYIKSGQTRSDGLSYWDVKTSFNSNEMESVDDDERSIALSE